MKTLKRTVFLSVAVVTLALALVVPYASGAVLQYRVVDNQSGAPVAGAYIQLVCSLPGGGTIPWDGVSDASGNVVIDTGISGGVLFWSVSASGYTSISGSGSPPSPIRLVPAGSANPPPVPPPNNNNGEIPPVPVGNDSSSSIMVIGLFVFSMLGVVYVFKNRRKVQK